MAIKNKNFKKAIFTTGIVLSGLLMSPHMLKANVISPNTNIQTYLNYYDDGVYDAIKQISKEAGEGLNEYPLDEQIKGRIVVGVSIENMSITDIIRINSIAIKNNYTSSVTAKNIKNEQNYIIFDSFDREADANYAIKRLSDYNIKATKIYNGKWVKNPIVIKRFLSSFKKGIFANMPVKVIEVDRIIYKKEPIFKNISENNKNDKSFLKTRDDNESIQKNIISTPSKINTAEILRNKKIKYKKLNSLIYHMKNSGRFLFNTKEVIFHNKHYKEGDFITWKNQKYKITKINIENDLAHGTKRFIILFNNFFAHHLVYQKKIKNSANRNVHKTDVQNNNSDTNQKKAAQEQNTANNSDSKNVIDNKSENVYNYYYVCDFSKIRTIKKINSKKNVLIANSPYSFLFNKKEKVLFVSNIDGYSYFKKSGQTPYGMPQNAWDSICKKAQ